MKYFIYFDTTRNQFVDNFLISHYTLEFHKADNNSDKRDFYDKCVDEYKCVNENDLRYPFDAEHDMTRMVMCIDIEVTDKKKIYCFDPMQNIDITFSDDGLTPTYYLGDGDANIFINQHKEEYADKINYLLEKINFKRRGETFILLINNKNYQFTHIDRDPEVNKKLKLN